MLELIWPARKGQQAAGQFDIGDVDSGDQGEELVASFELPGKSDAILARILEDGCTLELTVLSKTESETRPASPKRALQTSSVAIASSDDTAASALAWLPGLAPNGEPLLCVGFNHGGVSLFTHRGAVAVSFLVSHQRVVRVRPFFVQSAAGPDKLMLLHEHGILSLVEISSLQQVAFGKTSAVSADVQSTHGISGLRFHIYELRGRAEILDACMVASARPLEDPFMLPREPESNIAAVALGTQPFLSLHSPKPGAASGSAGRSLFGSAASALRSWVPFGARSSSAGYPADAAGITRPAGFVDARELRVHATGSPTELPVAAKFLDPTRQGERIEPAPLWGSHAATVAVTCDSFGRVALFCLETLRCLHLWKGYRDAQVAWTCPRDDQAMAEHSHEAPQLVIYAPRRGLLELWSLGGGALGGPKRVAAAVVGDGCTLIPIPGGYAHLLRSSGQLDRIVWVSLSTGGTGDQDSDAFDSVGSDAGDQDPKGCDVSPASATGTTEAEACAPQL
eukprot:TRINITY_DN64225_c0_g1_i1.p1 TRINITY_DN64225_c0_g1~~TRINITY_DN64225_c0_g1_i1.p1  ORF type:complete len:510 (+),score=83.36 TRINITY_DN64225_c0_g1_i1:107-1636(+)